MNRSKTVYCILISLIVVIFSVDSPLQAEEITLDQLIENIQIAYDETEDFTAAFTQKATIKTINQT
ncbi:MAG: hypothetical protein JXB42_05435, partial [Deltaproteobacteria bacterium]|nr:hypothetical protein [Deltaproteobacteria bacterium]